MTPKFELGRDYCAMHLPPNFIILCLLICKLSCWQTNKLTNEQRPLKHPTPGAAKGFKNWGGTGDIGPRTHVGHSNRGAAPRMAEGRAGGGRRSRNGSPGVSPREKFEIANAKSCILVHFEPCLRDLHPWMEAMHPLGVRRDRENYLEKWRPAADCSLRSWTFLHIVSENDTDVAHYDIKR